MYRECFSAIKSLRSNSNILINKPNKQRIRRGNFEQNRLYQKMNSVLENEAKFLTLGPSSGKDNTLKIESRIQCRLLQLHKDDLLPANLYDFISPTGSQRLRMYGFPKTHKKDATSTHSLYDRFSATPAGQMSFFLLERVLTLFSSDCIRDSFTFAEIIKTSNLDSSSVFLCSFDILSSFTDVTLAETIQIWAEFLYNSEHPPSPFPRQIFVELMEMAANSVESITSCMAKSEESLWDHPLDQPLPILLLATINLNFFRPLPSGNVLPLYGWHLRNIQQRSWMRSFLRQPQLA